VVLNDMQQIGFSGMSKTDFNFEIKLPSRFFGIRLKPGAFHQLTDLPAIVAIDAFFPLQQFDKSFDEEQFWNSSFENAKILLVDYVYQLVRNKEAGQFVHFFDDYAETVPDTAAELFSQLHYSPRQCQRLFQKHFALTPQMVLSILRFQKVLKMLMSNDAELKATDILRTVNYYDQAHFIRDFKKNAGLTPFELLRKYQK
jgi:AraC-like DNA-binding protein